MDAIDRRICEILSDDARQSLAQIGALVGLSTSAVNERLRRLLATGAIRRIRADVAPEAAGRATGAFVWLLLAPDADEAAFRVAVARMPEVCACDHVTGAWSYLIQIQVADLAQVEAFLGKLKSGGWAARSETVLSLSSVVAPPFRLRE